MSSLDIFSGHGAAPSFSGAAAEIRRKPKGSAGGGFIRWLFFLVLLGGSGFGAFQWLMTHPGATRGGSAVQVDGSSESTANDHLPASLPEIRVKERDEP